jgi:hypothetical protein
MLTGPFCLANESYYCRQPEGGPGGERGSGAAGTSDRLGLSESDVRTSSSRPGESGVTESLMTAGSQPEALLGDRFTCTMVPSVPAVEHSDGRPPGPRSSTESRIESRRGPETRRRPPPPHDPEPHSYVISSI